MFFSLSHIGFHYLLPFFIGRYNFTSDICAFVMLCFFAWNIAFVVYKPPLTNLSQFKHSLFFPSNRLFLHLQLNIPAVIVHIFIYVLTSNFSQSASVVYWLALSVAYRGFEPRWTQTKDYEICIFCFFTKHAALKSFFDLRLLVTGLSSSNFPLSKIKDWSARNQNNVSE